MDRLILICQCGQEMNIPASAMGKTGKCTLCGRVLTVSKENTRPAPAQPDTVARPAPAKPPSRLAPVGRILCIDQLRGYAIFGMIFVNFLGLFDVTPWIFKHHKTCYTYADTIAPVFIFVVGMGFRLSLQRRIEKLGAWQARWSAAKRYFTLFLVGVAFYGPNMRIDWWDALTDIGLAGLLALPFIDKGMVVRALASIGYLVLYMIIYMMTDYGPVFMMRSMNGGPVGPLSWALILLFGTIAYDLIAEEDTPKLVTWCLIWGLGFVAAAWIVWYFIPTDWAGYGEKWGKFWPFSKRWCIAPAMLLSTGICFLTVLFFYYVNEVWEFEFPHLTVLGQNPLIIYVLQYSLMEMNESYIPESSGFLLACIGFVCMYLFCYLAAKRLHDDNILIRL